ncbi:hypothetical protein XCR1_4160003 [Xenorhabdus cabanillasii JM26]|uniref:Uncharacterized protein n=1 Tax=Xenorhabdus cabanillasii JM26 TaxID=1427517 RepID=W1J9E1_9GAMM|nr:hypothetical protein XCR1_4160003 [Xenorhabdus cabanillasii JM26]
MLYLRFSTDEFIEPSQIIIHKLNPQKVVGQISSYLNQLLIFECHLSV